MQLAVLAVPHDIQLEPTSRILACLHDTTISSNWKSIGSANISVKQSSVAGTDDGSTYEGPEVLHVQHNAVSQLRARSSNHWVCAHRNIYSALLPEERETLTPAQLARRAPRLYSWFGYGMLGMTVGANSAVHVFGQRRDQSAAAADPFLYAGRYVTDRTGYLEVEAPEDMQHATGHYAIRAVMENDGTIGEGSVFVLERNALCVMMDLDGTLNVGDEAMTQQMTLDAVWAAQHFDARPQKGVLSVCRAWASRGYQLVYLSGRQGGFYNLTRAWLVRHGFPPGPVALTEHLHLAALPGKARHDHHDRCANLCLLVV